MAMMQRGESPDLQQINSGTAQKTGLAVFRGRLSTSGGLSKCFLSVRVSTVDT